MYIKILQPVINFFQKFVLWTLQCSRLLCFYILPTVQAGKGFQPAASLFEQEKCLFRDLFL